MSSRDCSLKEIKKSIKGVLDNIDFVKEDIIKKLEKISWLTSIQKKELEAAIEYLIDQKNDIKRIISSDNSAYFVDIVSALNDAVFKRVFKVILNKLNIDIDPKEKGDRMSIYAKNFTIFCKYKDMYKETVGRLQNPGIIMSGVKLDKNLFSTLKKYDAVNPRFFFIFDFLSDERDKHHDPIKKRYSSTDLITNKKSPGGFLVIFNIFLLSLYAFDELLDLMIKYL